MSLFFFLSRPSSFSFSVLLFNLFVLFALDAPFFLRAHALHLGITGHIGQPASSAQRLRARANLVGDIPIGDLSDVKYSANMTIGGAPFLVQIDTGSSDLWVASSSLSGSTSTGQTASVQYAIGNIAGPVVTDSVEFADQTVDNQALILVAPSSANPANQGLIGLGPNSGSHVAATLNSAAGAPVLQNIFSSGVRPYLTVALGREADPAAPQPGDLTVGEVLANQSAVLKQPKLPMAVAGGGGQNQHWQTLLDKDGIIGPDGKVIQAASTVVGTKTPDQLNVVFDTGFTLPQVPLNVASEIYGRVQGASFQNVSGVGMAWTIPCGQELNISFKFGGVTYPIHPLDTSMDFPGVTTSGGQPACLGAFQPILSSAQQGSFDMILGMAFLRNVYLLVNFGNTANTTSSSGSGSGVDPYMQLLSTTDPATAHEQFVETRLGGQDTTGALALLAPSVIPASLLVTPTPAATPAASATDGAIAANPIGLTTTTSSSSSSAPASTTAAATSTTSRASPTSTGPATAVGAAENGTGGVAGFFDKVKVFFTDKRNMKYIIIGASVAGGLLLLSIVLCIWAGARRRRRRRMDDAFMRLP